MMAGAPQPDHRHEPVMAEELLAQAALRDGDIVIDGTLGRGGHARRLLDQADCSLIAIDRDPEAIDACRETLADFGDRIRFAHGRFGELDQHALAAGFDQVDAVILDLGVSSPQLDDPKRGFSFRFDAPLDMRMEASGQTAADWINAVPQAELAETIRDFGEERKFRRVAKAIVDARAEAPILTTGQLANIVRATVGRSADGIDPATRTFQAIRIKTNDEIGEIARGLAAAERILRPGGRLVVISFHSGEDRLVKQFMRQASERPALSRHMPAPLADERAPTFTLPHRKALNPKEEEARRNPRARSARLRSAIRTEAPARTSGQGGTA